MISVEESRNIKIIRMGDVKVLGSVVEGANTVSIKDALHFKEVNRETLMKWIQAKNLGDLKTINLYNQMFTTEDLSLKNQLIFEQLLRLHEMASDIAEITTVNQVFANLCNSVNGKIKEE